VRAARTSIEGMNLSCFHFADRVAHPSHLTLLDTVLKVFCWLEWWYHPSLLGPGNECLVCYVATGNLAVFSLPSLRILHNVEFLPLKSIRWVASDLLSSIMYGIDSLTLKTFHYFTFSSHFDDLDALEYGYEEVTYWWARNHKL
jgi:hypothetical protein